MPDESRSSAQSLSRRSPENRRYNDARSGSLSSKTQCTDNALVGNARKIGVAFILPYPSSPFPPSAVVRKLSRHASLRPRVACAVNMMLAPYIRNDFSRLAGSKCPRRCSRTGEARAMPIDFRRGIDRPIEQNPAPRRPARRSSGCLRASADASARHGWRGNAPPVFFPLLQPEIRRPAVRFGEASALPVPCCWDQPTVRWRTIKTVPRAAPLSAAGVLRPAREETARERSPGTEVPRPGSRSPRARPDGSSCPASRV